MGNPTVTRAEMRQQIGLDIQMPFYQRFPTGRALTVAATDLSELTDDALTQSHHYWKGQWYLQTSGADNGEFRRIVDFWQDQDKFILEHDLGNLPSENTTYEITSIWSPAEIHKAINQAVDAAFPAFFEVVTEEPIVYTEDTNEFSLRPLKNCYRILKVWTEVPTKGAMGTAQSATSTSLTAASGADLSDVEANPSEYKLSVYAGTGEGQVRDVASATDSTDVIDISGTWKTDPDNTSKYRYWNIKEQLRTWLPLNAIRFDQMKWPSTMYLNERYANKFGLRFRFQYIRKPLAMTKDKHTCVVPADYISYKARSILFRKRSGDPRTLASYRGTADDMERDSINYIREKHWKMPDSMIWQDSDERRLGSGEFLDPLAWHDGR